MRATDRVGRKRIVYASSMLQAVVPIVLIFRANMNIAVILGVVFGLGYGAYTAVEYCDVFTAAVFQNVDQLLPYANVVGTGAVSPPNTFRPG